MKQNRTRHFAALAVLCTIFLNISAYAQSFVRYALPSDIGTKAMYADSILNSVILPKGVFRVDNNLSIQEAAYELADILKNPDIDLLKVYVCGSASPDGLWQENVTLSQARTEATTRYLRSVTGIPVNKIVSKSLNEDWDRLYEMVEASDIPYKSEVLYIISTKTWGERKEALKTLAGGQVWSILVNDFFPQLRCVRVTFFCAWDKTKPYLSYPSPSRTMTEPELYGYYEEPDPVSVPVAAAVPNSATTVVSVPMPSPAPVPVTSPSPVRKSPSAPEVRTAVETIVIRDTVYIKENINTPTASAPQVQESAQYTKTPEKVSSTPWRMGFKTNLFADAIVVPTLGWEIQIGRKLSLDLEGFYTNYNLLVPEDNNTNLYGLSPELRWWPGGKTMKEGTFLGIHGRCAWYTLQWTDGLLYQNGPADMWEGNYHNAGNYTPAWSVGVTYGYSVGLGRKDNWGLEFVLGVGYATYMHNTAKYNNNIWELVEHSGKLTHIGITRAGINLTYRFPLRKVEPAE